jgi:hypothetical protein
MRRRNGCVIVLLFLLLGIIAYAFYDIGRNGSGKTDSSSPGGAGTGVAPAEERPNTPRNEQDAQKARREGKLRDDE